MILSIPRLTLSVLMSSLMVGAMIYCGFVVYVLQLEPKSPDTVTDAVIVLTGGPGRVNAGFEIIAEGRAKTMLITGVHPDVRLPDLLRGDEGSLRRAVLEHCCVSLGYVAESTEDNAIEAAEWVRAQNMPENISIRVVTSDFHMPRALLQFRRALPQAQVYPWPVRSNSQDPHFWRNLTSEFGKFILGLLSYRQAQDA